MKRYRGFTLVEMLIVVAIIAVLAGLVMTVAGMVVRKSVIQRAQGEEEALTLAIDHYQKQYGFYPASGGNSSINPLYYELIGTRPVVTNGMTNFVTLDGLSTISSATAQKYFGVNGFMNCTHGSGDDAVQAQTFLPGLKASQRATSSDGVVVIVTGASADPTYQPMPGFTTASGNANPWIYLCPGVNNPNSYDLSVQIYVGGKTNQICNWTTAVQVK